jgi:hypothetical protein
MLTPMNDEQLKGVAGAIFQLANILLVATLVVPFVAEPEKWPKSYAILEIGVAGLCFWFGAWAYAWQFLGVIGRQQVDE